MNLSGPLVSQFRRSAQARGARHGLATSCMGLAALALAGCGGGPRLETTERSVHSLANGCFALSARIDDHERYLVANADGTQFAFRSHGLDTATRFFAKAADLGVFILRDPDGGYPVAETKNVMRSTLLYSDTLLNDDSYVSPAEWEFEVSPGDATRFRLHNRATDSYLGARGTTTAAHAVSVAMSETTDCAEFPELTVDATAEPLRTHFDDGTLFGFVDAHEHLFTNFGFGGGGTFHGSPFHRLGVEHALPDCEPFHGADGRRDLLGYFYGSSSFDPAVGAVSLITGETPEFDHYTAGYPDFTDWPNSWRSFTHQMQYYKWVERAYLSGLRLFVQHATSNQVLCELVTGVHAQNVRNSCNEMVSAERSVQETYALERYIDAQLGGPGLGWFRVVTTPAEAREVIASGKMAVVLGIETSNLFDCYLTPHAGYTTCDDATVIERLQHFHDLGVRALFPVHKFDNGFSAGDGSRGFIEIGNLINSGHYSNFTQTCDLTVPAGFDHGGVNFGGMNMPRAVYDSPPPIDISHFATDPVGVLYPQLPLLSSPPLPGEWCQSTGLTPLGETLITQMMRRGMIIEIDHLPKPSYARAVQMLVANDYPPAGTHGTTANGTLYALGGISATGLPRCGNAANPMSVVAPLRARIAEIVANGGYPAQGFGFDLNGFAGGPRPRFGVDSGCSGVQTDPVTYPFTSYAGDVVFDEPDLGNRTVDFNNEGMIHIGLLPEYIEDARHMGVTDADLEPIFRSAEGYIRMWEKAESRGAALRAAGP